MSEILVIGGGVIGLMTARELVEAGASVILVEMSETGQEASWAGGGIISPLYPWRQDASINALALWSQARYGEFCDRLTAETGVNPEHVQSGLLILDPEETDTPLTWAAEQGVRMDVLERDAVAAIEPDLGIKPARALWMPQIAQVRNPRLNKALRHSIEKRATIREHEEVVELLVEDGRARGARTRKDEIHADSVVICTGAWTARLLEQLGAPPEIRPVRGQMILFHAHPGDIRHIVLYRERYVIPRGDGRVLIGSTLEQAGFAKETTAEAKEELYRTAVEMFPSLKHTPIEDHWAGLRPGSPSGIPYIGAYPGVEGIYFNAGHFRNGLVTGPASARLAADLILGREPILDPAPYALGAHR